MSKQDKKRRLDEKLAADAEEGMTLEATIRRLKYLIDDGSVFYRHLSPTTRQAMISAAKETLKSKFMEYPMFFVMNLSKGEKLRLSVLMTDFVKLKAFSVLLNSVSGDPIKKEVRLFVDEKEREELYSRLTVDEMIHLDDTDFYVDELIAKHGQIFGFDETKDPAGFLEKIRQKRSRDITKLELQYLHQLKNVFENLE